MSKQLLFSVTKKDFDIDYFNGTGKGGQHRNKHANCVRLKHRDSGVMVTAQESRKKEQNLSVAFKRILDHPTFQFWYRFKCAELMRDQESENRKIDRIVSSQIKEENLKIEYYPIKGE